LRRCGFVDSLISRRVLSGWRDTFLAAGEAALTTKPTSGEELESERLKAKLGAALIDRDLLNEKIARLEANRPLARQRFRRDCLEIGGAGAEAVASRLDRGSEVSAWLGL
jgi:hypothetical protein